MKSLILPSRGLAKALTALTTLALANTALPCTRVLWNSGNGHVIVGRTQDWTEKANSAFRVYPRGIERTGAVAANPHKWTSKYGSLALSAYDMGTHEGINEKKKMPDIFPGFEKCIPSNKWNAKGHMHEPGICQGCAQDLPGVVY